MSRPVRRQRAPRYTVLPALARAPARVCMHFDEDLLAGVPDTLAGAPDRMDEDL